MRNPFAQALEQFHEPWQEQAVCGRMNNAGEHMHDPELWFATPTQLAEQQLAMDLCAKCPVSNECFERALDRRERWGIYGGVNFLREHVGVGYPVARSKSELREDRMRHLRERRARREAQDRKREADRAWAEIVSAS